MRNGEKIKCPKCENGFFSAIGDPKTTKVFRCDSCQTGMVLTVLYEKTLDTIKNEREVRDIDLKEFELNMDLEKEFI